MSAIVGRFDSLDISASPSPTSLPRGYAARSFSTPTLPLSSSPQDFEEAPIRRSPTYRQIEAGSSTSNSTNINSREGKRPAPAPLSLPSPTDVNSRYRSASSPVPITIEVTNVDQQTQGIRSKANTISGPLGILNEDDEENAGMRHSLQSSSDSGYSTSASANTRPISSQSTNFQTFSPSTSPRHTRLSFPTTPPSARTYHLPAPILSPALQRNRESVYSTATVDTSRTRNSSISNASDKLHLLTARMRSQVSQDWIGVNNMEVLRGYSPHDLRLQMLLTRIAEREKAFLADRTGQDVLARLRSNMTSQEGDHRETDAQKRISATASASSSSTTSEIIASARLDGFIDSVFAAHFQLLECHRQFLSAVQDASMRVAAQGNAAVTIAQLFLDHSQKLSNVYLEYGEDLWYAQRILVDESETNFGFRRFLQETLLDGRTIANALEDYLQKPFQQVKEYPTFLQAALNNSPKDSGNSSSAEALRIAIPVVDKLVVDAKLLAWQMTLGKDAKHQITWSDLMFEQYDIDSMEVERQTVIFELIHEEMLWVRKLALFNTLFVEPLQSASPAILTPAKLNYFLIAVGSVQGKLHEQHFHFLRQLQAIQRDQCPVIKSLIKPSGMAEIDWIHTYEVTYAASTNEAIAWIREEIAVNPAFDHFLSRATFHDESDGQNIEERLVGPLLYINRCLKLLRRILDKTPEDNEDAVDIPPLIRKLERVYAACKKIWPNSEGREALAELAPMFIWTKNGTDLDVDVEHPSRFLLYDGRVWVHTEPEGDQDAHVFVLDNYLLVTHPVERKGALRFEVKRSPIPLELLELIPTQGRDATRISPNTSGGVSVTTPVRLGRKDKAGVLTLLLSSVADARQWEERLTHAISRRLDLVEEKYQSFQFKTIYRGFTEATCSLTVPSEETITLLACNAPEPGIWVIRPKKAPLLALPAQFVTQMGVISGLLIVLAARTTTAYKLDNVLDGPPVSISQTLQLNETEFFRIHQGEQQDTLVLIRKHKNRHVLELYRIPKPPSRSIVKLPKKMHLLDKIIQSEIPVPCHDIVFMKSRAVMLSSNGFLFTNIDIGTADATSASKLKHLQPTALPFPNDPWKELVQKCSNSKPLTILRSSESSDVLLCFDRIGVFIDNKGKLTGKSIEWTTEKVNRIVSFAPYLVVLGPRVVEVRHAMTGKLRQIMAQPYGLKVTWDGLGAWKGKRTAVARQIHVVSIGPDSQQLLQELTYQPQSFIL